MKILLTGGGTAGHVYPALAMAEAVKNKYSDAEFVFIGRAGGDENKAVSLAGYKLHTLDVVGISRRLTPKNLSAISKALRAVGKAKRLIHAEAPDMVIGTGGYVCWPVLRAACAMKIPTLIHESNAYPGLVTRLLSKKCDAVLLGFGEAERHIKGAKRIYTVGNPVRDAFRAISREDARRALGISPSELFILSFGGSLGAERLNEAVLGWFEHADGKRYRLTHVHATGRRHFAELEKRRGAQKNASPLRIVPYVDNMPLWLSAADLAITRSGAMTVAELCTAGIPSVLIPSPNVTDDHQHKNALEMQRSGRSILMPESELSAEALTKLLESLYKDRAPLSAMRAALTQAYAPDAREEFMKVFEKIYPF